MMPDVEPMGEALILTEVGPISTTISHVGFNKSPLCTLPPLEAIGSSTRLAGADAGDTIAAAALEARDFPCTSLSSEAV